LTSSVPPTGAGHRLAVAFAVNQHITHCEVAPELEQAGGGKNAPGANFPDDVVDAVKVIASGLHAQSVAKLDQMKASGELKEICDAEKDP